MQKCSRCGKRIETQATVKHTQTGAVKEQICAECALSAQSFSYAVSGTADRVLKLRRARAQKRSMV